MMLRRVNELLNMSTYKISSSIKKSFINNLSDEQYVKLVFKRNAGYKLELNNPQTYNEKLQWLKLYDRKTEYTMMVDKYLVKNYVAEKIGEKYVVPTYGVWENFEDINFNNLPNQFVLKTTHDSGGVVICRNKQQFDIKKAKNVIESSLRQNYYLQGREWPYKNVKPRIIVEKYLTDSNNTSLPDYKFFVFNGIAKAMFIATDRDNPNVETKFDFFDMDFNHLNFTNGHPNTKNDLKIPEFFYEMKELAETLGENIHHVRVDFYEANEKIYFGELTFFHWSGMMPFIPNEWDYIFGSWIKLPIESLG